MMVIDAGRIIEFAEPHILLEDSSSTLSCLVAKLHPNEAANLRDIAKEAYLTKHTHTTSNSISRII